MLNNSAGTRGTIISLFMNEEQNMQKMQTNSVVCKKETTPHSFKVYHSTHLSPFTQIALVLKGYCTQDAWLQVRFTVIILYTPFITLVVPNLPPPIVLA